MTGEEQTCALRALTLCDGQVLEEPEHALTRCICSALQSSESVQETLRVQYRRAHFQRLIEEAMAPLDVR